MEECQFVFEIRETHIKLMVFRESKKFEKIGRNSRNNKIDKYINAV